MRYHTAVALFAAMVFCSPLKAQPADSAEAIKALEAQWSAMFGAGDLDGVASLLAEDSVLIMPGAAPISDRAAILEATRAMMASGDTVSWQSDFAVVAPSGEMAYDYGTATTRTADGEEITGRYLVVWIKEDGEWKVAADMFN